jgi:hypothetical protein
MLMGMPVNDSLALTEVIDEKNLDKDILVESKSKNTYENAKYSAKILKRKFFKINFLILLKVQFQMQIYL